MKKQESRSGKKLKSGLAAIFKTINLWEYKSPEDSLGSRIYYRSVGYAFLYLCYKSDGAEEKEVTLSFLREGKPEKLLKWFEEKGFRIIVYEPGIYHIFKTGHMDMQVVVSRELDKDEYHWITKLTDRVERDDLKKLQDDLKMLKERKDERDLLNAESVYDLMCRLNADKEWMKEEEAMGYLRDMFKDEFEERDQKIRDLSEQLEQKDTILQQNQEQLQQNQEQLQQNQKQLEQNREQLQQNRKQLEEKDKEIAVLRQKLAMMA